MRKNIKKLYGWGRYPKFLAKEAIPHSESELLDIIHNSESFIARGNGRSYGDSAVNKNLTITMTSMNKILKWNQDTGELIAEAGLLLADIIDTFLPRGWFPYVTPGTKFITLGGAIASDVHGKNHHSEGSFGNHVNWIEMVNNKNEIIRCSQFENPDLFRWTIGGMGLTGVIVRCSIQLKRVESGWIKQRIISNTNLRETFRSFFDNQETTYAVAWIDCLSSGKSFGQSILMLGEHAEARDIKSKNPIYPKRKNSRIRLYFDAPTFLLNNWSVRIFNKLYFLLNKNKKTSFVDWDSYFYPLDVIKDWNRIYGKKGFFQFQCLLPEESSEEGYEKMLAVIQKSSSGSFLAVLKNFGNGNDCLSFPSKGFTLALDFKVTDKNIAVTKELMEIVNEYKGSIYLAKDATMNSSQFLPQINTKNPKEFFKYRNNFIKSEQSIRLNL